MKTDQELLKIWEDNTAQKLQGMKDFLNLTTEERSRIFDLISNTAERGLND